MAKLTYTSESKGFTYEDGGFVLLGSKLTVDGKMTAVESGQIKKGEAYAGNFYIRIENDKPIISINNVASEDMVTVVALIGDLYEALKD